MTIKTQFTVEALVIRGDGIPDGDLVTKYVNGKVKERLFIPFAKMKVILKKTTQDSNNIDKKGKSEKFVYVSVPQNMGDSEKRLIVQSGSKLGHYIKQGGLEEIGAVMVNGLLKILMMMFV